MRRMLIDPKHEDLLREALWKLREALQFVSLIADAERGEVQNVLHSMMRRISSADRELEKLRRRRPPKPDGIRAFSQVSKWGGTPPPWLDEVSEKARLAVLRMHDDGEPPVPPEPPPPPED